MSSEQFIAKANAINEATALITKLTNFQSAIRDFDRLRLDGAKFLSMEDEEFQEYMADLDGLCALAMGPAGDAVKKEMRDVEPLERLCAEDEVREHVEFSEQELRAIGLAVDMALAKAQERLQKILVEE